MAVPDSYVTHGFADAGIPPLHQLDAAGAGQDQARNYYPEGVAEVNGTMRNFLVGWRTDVFRVAPPDPEDRRRP